MKDARSALFATPCTYDLEAGSLTLTTSLAGGRELFRIAERINPKRAFLFVSTVLGRHIPVDPADHRAVLWELADKVSAHLLPGPVFVMGFAETAVGIGAGVFDCLRLAHDGRDMGYLTTTRFSASGSCDWFTIKESHSHAVDHIILKPRSGVLMQGPDATLVLVDDETTTGKTFLELASGLRDQGLQFGRIVLVTLTDWSDGQAIASLRGVFGDADVFSVCLQQGSWDWVPDLNRTGLPLPGGCDACCARWTPDAGQVFAAPRTGIAAAEVRQTGDDIWDAVVSAGFVLPRATDRVLVIGAGEHVWQPMLAAESLCKSGVYTRFITTTRSPILRGDTIRHKVTFADHYGQGFQMYVHNVVPSDWDRIVLFTETGVDTLAPDLLSWLGQVDVIDGSGAVTSVKA